MRDLLPGGKADKIPPSRFPLKKVRAGEKVEHEHTYSHAIAREIARDHLSEDPKYYEKLHKMEKGGSIDSMFDELLKISSALSGKGALLGGTLGTGIGALRAISRESRERMADERARLTPEELKKFRKKRLGSHAASITNWALLGAGLGSAHRGVGQIAGKITKGIREGVQPEVNQFLADTAKHIKNVGGGTARHLADQAAEQAKTHIPSAVAQTAKEVRSRTRPFLKWMVRK